MDSHYVQNLRYKLQKRFRRLNSIPWNAYHVALGYFWAFIHNHEFLRGIISGLLARCPEAAETASKVVGEGKALLGDTESEAAGLGYLVVKHCVESGEHRTPPAIEIGCRYTKRGQYAEILQHFTEIFVEPLYEFIDEQMDDWGAILGLLLRYKRRAEWFHRDRLYDVWQSRQLAGEKTLVLDMYEFLFEQGIELHIEPASVSGEVDMISAQMGNERLLADAKIFNPEKGKGTDYLARGVKQLYTYALDYNEPVAYLVVFNTSPEEVKFALKTAERGIPCLSLNGKSIFFVTVDIYPHAQPASKRGHLRAHEITEDYIVRTVQGPAQRESVSQGESAPDTHQ